MFSKVKKSPSIQISILAFFIIIAMLLILALSFFTTRKENEEIPTHTPTSVTVIIDPGHGGEDGGASDKNGTLEKDLNLSVAKKLENLFSSSGVNVIMTRNEDKLLYDPNSDFQGRKKILDMRERVRIVSENENAILISIHMNAFPQDQYKGLQVYYSDRNSKSKEIAEKVQSTVSSLLQRDNTRKIKCGKDIFLLDRVTSPAILVECGFLSNPEEAKMLSDNTYRDKIAFCIFYALSAYLE